MQRSVSYPAGEVVKLLSKMLLLTIACESLIMVILPQLQWLAVRGPILDRLLLFLIAAPVFHYLVTPTIGTTLSAVKTCMFDAALPTLWNKQGL